LAFKLKRESTGELLVLEEADALGTGGEATVYSLQSESTLAAKVYLKPNDDRARKLTVMTANPPAGTSLETGEPDIAWPLDLLWTTGRKSRIAGFLMPRVEDMAPIINIYSPHARLMSRPWFDYRLLLRTCIGLAGAVETAHQSGYIIGDLNHSNIFVASDGRVTLIDADSFQVRDPESGDAFLCPVYTPEFTAPELHHQGLIRTERSLAQDNFGLGVLFFLLLMGGVHPFSGVYLGKGEPPALFTRIATGDFPYSRKKRVMITPPAIAVPFDTLTEKLQDLFQRCFEDGHLEPEQRPTSSEWQEALIAAEQELVICETNAQHQYASHQSACPWCTRTQQLGGRDPFPSNEAVANGQHRRPIPVQRTLARDRVPTWRFQEQRMRRARIRTGANLKTWHWVVLVSMLWAVLPALWALSVFYVEPLRTFVGFLAAIFYGMTTAMVPVAAGMVGWRRATSARNGGGWIILSALGLFVGGGLMTLISVLAFY
jgi:DNA-binding helix-hairpin-helix protein with protein kinase domain